jgi:hypothetical protein
MRVLTVSCLEIKVTGLPRLSGNRFPDPFAVVTIDRDKESEYKTPKLKKKANPSWKTDVTRQVTK